MQQDVLSIFVYYNGPEEVRIQMGKPGRRLDRQ